MNGKHLSKVTFLGIYLTLCIFAFYLVLQVPQFAVLKLTITNRNTKPCKYHTEVCKCNSPNMYMQFIQLERYEHFVLNISSCGITMASNSRSFEFTTAIQGYHVYQKNWLPELNETLVCIHERRNEFNALV